MTAAQVRITMNNGEVIRVGSFTAVTTPTPRPVYEDEDYCSTVQIPSVYYIVDFPDKESDAESLYFFIANRGFSNKRFLVLRSAHRQVALNYDLISKIDFAI